MPTYDLNAATSGLQVDSADVLRGGGGQPGVQGDVHAAVAGQAPRLRLPQRDGGQGVPLLAQDRQGRQGEEDPRHRHLQVGRLTD